MQQAAGHRHSKGRVPKRNFICRPISRPISLNILKVAFSHRAESSFWLALKPPKPFSTSKKSLLQTRGLLHLSYECTSKKFGAEDYCADLGISRTLSGKELLLARSLVANTGRHCFISARAYGMEAIDMVCLQYKDAALLKAECLDGFNLGFTGKVQASDEKQCIHPSQISVIQECFTPSANGQSFLTLKILISPEPLHANT